MTTDLSFGIFEAFAAITIMAVAAVIALTMARYAPAGAARRSFPASAHFIASRWVSAQAGIRAERKTDRVWSELAKKSRIFTPAAGAAPANRRARNVPYSFPAPLPMEAHWQRVAAAVEQALARASSMRQHQSAATEQLQAAEYALHVLLDELSTVMAPGVVSPLQGRIFEIKAGHDVPTAMAA